MAKVSGAAARLERTGRGNARRSTRAPTHGFIPRALERVFSLTAGGYAADLELQVTTFVRFFLMHMAARDWLKLADAPSGTRLWLASGFTACFVAAMAIPRQLPAIVTVAMGLATWKLAWNLPHPSNHYAIEYLCLVFLCILRPWRPGEREHLVCALRWLPAWAFLASGIQKLLYSTYFTGTFLAVLAREERFALVLRHVLPSAELAQVTDPAYAGPYRLRSKQGLLLSNAVYLLEIAAAVLVMVRPFRRFGVVFAICLLAAIETGARELTFGLLMTALLSLYLSERATLGVFALAALAYPLLIAMRVGVIPGLFFN